MFGFVKSAVLNEEINKYDNAERDSVPSEGLKAVAAYKIHQEFYRDERDEKRSDDADNERHYLRRRERKPALHGVFRDFEKRRAEHDGNRKEEREFSRGSA